MEIEGVKNETEGRRIEGMDAENEGVEPKIKEWKMKAYLLSEKYIAYRILPPSTTMMKYPIGAPRNCNHKFNDYFH